MTTPVLIVHGGAGRIPESAREERAEGLTQALDAGWAVLANGGSALDAVVAAVRVMEDLSMFNAGRGSALTRAGTVEMDAGVMDGATLGVGAVAGVRRVAHPILLARRVLDASPHIFLAGEGAEVFALEQGIPLVEPEALVTEKQRQALARRLAALAPTVADTVGAVALDARGHLAAATSTGGIVGKMPGRVGDSPLVGCGFYADDMLGACSATGIGESIARALLSFRAVSALSRLDAQRAAEDALAYMAERVGGQAGLILLARDGRMGIAWNSPHMSYAFRTVGDEQVVG